MENNEKQVINTPATEPTNSTPPAEAEPAKTLGGKIRDTWFWKNRGKIGVAVGAVVAFVVGSLLGNGGSDETGNDSTIDND